MEKFKLISLLVLLICINSCKLAEVVIADSNETIAYDVVGKNKPQWKTKINFGKYVAAETSKNFNTETNTEVELENNLTLYKNKKARQKIEFILNNTENSNKLDVIAVHNLNISNFDQLKDFSKILTELGDGQLLNTKTEADLNPNDYFLGAIRQEGDNKIMRFGISDVSASSLRSATGYLFLDNRVIDIKEIEEVTKGALPVASGENIVYGFSFTENGKHLATVRTFGKGKVFFEKGLTLVTADHLAAVCSALLLKKTP